jgi:hypothetical protein
VQVVEGRGDRVGVVLVDYDVLGVTAVYIPASEGGRGAEILSTTEAVATFATGSREPRRPHPVALDETLRAVAEFIDDTDDLVTRDYEGTPCGQVALGEVQIGATDPARHYAKTNLARTRIWNRALDTHERTRVDWPRDAHRPG